MWRIVVVFIVVDGFLTESDYESGQESSSDTKMI